MKYHHVTKTLGYYEISGARAIDGDTIECIVHLPFRTMVVKRVRLQGFWAPELDGPDPAAGEAAQECLQKFLNVWPCMVFSRSERADKYGRVIATLFTNGKPVHPQEVLGIWQLTEEEHKRQADAARMLRAKADLGL